MANGSDLVLVVAGADDPDRQELVAVAGEGPGAVRHIADAGQLRADWLASAATIGVAATSSASAGAVEEVVRALSGLGPLSVVRRQIATEVAAEWEHEADQPDHSSEQRVTTG